MGSIKWQHNMFWLNSLLEIAEKSSQNTSFEISWARTPLIPIFTSHSPSCSNPPSGTFTLNRLAGARRKLRSQLHSTARPLGRLSFTVAVINYIRVGIDWLAFRRSKWIAPGHWYIGCSKETRFRGGKKNLNVMVVYFATRWLFAYHGVFWRVSYGTDHGLLILDIWSVFWTLWTVTLTLGYC